MRFPQGYRKSVFDLVLHWFIRYWRNFGFKDVAVLDEQAATVDTSQLWCIRSTSKSRTKETTPIDLVFLYCYEFNMNLESRLNYSKFHICEIKNGQRKFIPHVVPANKALDRLENKVNIQIFLLQHQHYPPQIVLGYQKSHFVGFLWIYYQPIRRNVNPRRSPLPDSYWKRSFLSRFFRASLSKRLLLIGLLFNSLSVNCLISLLG